jgi:hypothetical protein
MLVLNSWNAPFKDGTKFKQLAAGASAGIRGSDGYARKLLAGYA